MLRVRRLPEDAHRGGALPVELDQEVFDGRGEAGEQQLAAAFLLLLQLCGRLSQSSCRTAVRRSCARLARVRIPARRLVRLLHLLLCLVRLLMHLMHLMHLLLVVVGVQREASEARGRPFPLQGVVLLAQLGPGAQRAGQGRRQTLAEAHGPTDAALGGRLLVALLQLLLQLQAGRAHQAADLALLLLGPDLVQLPYCLQVEQPVQRLLEQRHQLGRRAASSRLASSENNHFAAILLFSSRKYLLENILILD